MAIAIKCNIFLDNEYGRFMIQVTGQTAPWPLSRQPAGKSQRYHGWFNVYCVCVYIWRKVSMRSLAARNQDRLYKGERIRQGKSEKKRKKKDRVKDPERKKKSRCACLCKIVRLNTFPGACVNACMSIQITKQGSIMLTVKQCDCIRLTLITSESRLK